MHLFSIRTKEGAEGSDQELLNRKKKYKYNEVIKRIGFGPYQYKIVATVAVMSLSVGVYVAMLSFIIPLFKKDVHMSQFEISILISTQGMAALLGGILFSYLSDIFGRKFSLLCSLFSVISCSVGCVFTHSFYPFCAIRAVSTMGYGGMMPVAITYMAEYLPDDKRGFYQSIIDIFRSLGGLLTVLAAWLSGESWQKFVLFPVPFFTVCLIVMIIFLPESSRYLLYKNRAEDLVKCLNQMCEQNGQQITIRYSQYDEEETDKHNKKRGKKVSICRDLIIKKWDTTIPLLLLWFFPAFGTGVFVFLPEILLMKDFTLDEIYLLSGYLMVIPMCSMFVTSFFIDMFGRKQVISLSALVAGLCLWTFLLISDNNHKINMFYVILGVYTIFLKALKVVTTVYTPELYPTSIRTTALGVMNGADRAASILQPIIFTSLVYSSFKLAMFGFGLTFLIGFIVSFSLTQETVNKPLTESFLSEGDDNDVGTQAVKTSMYSDR